MTSSDLSWVKGVVGGLVGLALGSSAWAQYQPSYATLRMVEQIHVHKDWTQTRRSEYEFKVLTRQGIESLGEMTLPFNPKLESLRILEAYTQQPDGSKDWVAADRIRIQDDDADTGNGIYGENKVKLIIFPKLRVGSTVHYIAEWKRHTPYFPRQFAYSMAFSPTRIIERAQIQISHDATLPIQVWSTGMSAIDATPSRSTNQITHAFEYRQPQAASPEDSMVSPYDFAPRVYASSQADWADVARAYQARARPQAQPDEAITQLAKSITQDAATDAEKTQLIYRWITRNIRYLGVFSASGGYVPVPARQVLKERYGDCKGHATLFEAMLRSVGIESSQALINTKPTFKVPDIPTYNRFNHVINYIPSLGLFADTTSRFVRFGSLPSDLEGKPTLLATSGEIRWTPVMSPTDDHTQTQTEMILQPDGRVIGTSTTLQKGFYEQYSRGLMFRRSNKDKAKVVNDILSQHHESGRGSMNHPDPIDVNVPWEIKSEFELEPVILLDGLSAMPIPVGLTPGRFQTFAQTKADGQSKFPKECGSSMHEEQITLSLPPDIKVARLPKPMRYQSPVITYTSDYRLTEQSIQISRHFVAQRLGVVCDNSDDQDWQAFGRLIRQDLLQQIFLESATKH
jgi:transglutaminase-like putative cysteine protease